MLKPNNHPDAQLNRVRGVLHSLVDHEIAAPWAKKALGTYDPVHLYTYLYSVAEACNPFPRSNPKWRARCMREAYSRSPRTAPDSVYRCKLAATFYLLSEGLYTQPTLPSL